MPATTYTPAQIAALQDVLAGDITDVLADRIGRSCDRLLAEQHLKGKGGKRLAALTNEWGPVGDTYRWLRSIGVLKLDDSELGGRTDRDRLAIVAREQAAQQAAEIVAKLSAKTGGAQLVRFSYRGAGAFTASFVCGAHQIAVEQNPVLKFSSKGRPFYQWPARVYVDGKPTKAKDVAAAISTI